MQAPFYKNGSIVLAKGKILPPLPEQRAMSSFSASLVTINGQKILAQPNAKRRVALPVVAPIRFQDLASMEASLGKKTLQKKSSETNSLAKNSVGKKSFAEKTQNNIITRQIKYANKGADKMIRFGAQKAVQIIRTSVRLGFGVVGKLGYAVIQTFAFPFYFVAKIIQMVWGDLLRTIAILETTCKKTVQFSLQIAKFFFERQVKIISLCVRAPIKIAIKTFYKAKRPAKLVPADPYLRVDQFIMNCNDNLAISSYITMAKLLRSFPGCINYWEVESKLNYEELMIFRAICRRAGVNTEIIK